MVLVFLSCDTRAEEGEHAVPMFYFSVAFLCFLMFVVVVVVGVVVFVGVVVVVALLLLLLFFFLIYIFIYFFQLRHKTTCGQDITTH